MPNYWYNYQACKGDSYLQSICADKKPYFMIYVYDDYKAEYNKYKKECNVSCLLQFGMPLDTLLSLKDKTDEQNKFISYYLNKMPFGVGDCAMNRICRYIEDEFKGIVSKRKKESSFDYRKLKSSVSYSKEVKEKMTTLLSEYANYVRDSKDKQKYVDKDDRLNNRALMKRYFKSKAEGICPNKNQLLNVVLDLCYKHDGNKQFCWDVVGGLIIDKLKRMED